MTQTTFGVKETAQRLGISTESVRNMERDGKLHRLPDIPGVRYSAAEIHHVETNGLDAEVVTAWKYKQKVDENYLLRRENNKLRSIIHNMINLGMGVNLCETDHD